MLISRKGYLGVDFRGGAWDNPLAMMHTAQSSSQTVILGGGLAGLSAAWESLERGAGPVTVLEMDSEVGGMARSLEVDGLRSDLGPHRIYSCIPAMRQWFQDFLGDELLTVERRSRMYFDGQWMQYPPSPLELLKVMGFGRMARFGAGWLSAKLRSATGKLPPDSFAAVMEANFGRPMCEALVFPYIRKTWKLEPSEISADAAKARATMGGPLKMLKRMVTGKEKPGEESSLREFHYIRGGIGEIARLLAEKIERAGGRILTETEVTQLDVTDGKVTRVWFADKNGHSHYIEADFVYATIPITQLVEALTRGGFSDESATDAAKRLRFLRTMLAFLVVNRPSVSEDHWLYFPQEEPQITRAYEPKNFDASMGDNKRTLMCVEATDLDGGIEWRLRGNDLAREFSARIASTGVLDEKDVIARASRKIDYAYPLYEKGYDANLQFIYKALSELENLLTLGRQGLFQHNNMDHTIYTALKAVQCRSESQKPAAKWLRELIPGFKNFRIVD